MLLIHNRFFLMFAIPKCLAHIWIYNVSVKQNTIIFNKLFYYLGQHVSTLIESRSGPFKIHILNNVKMHCGIPNANILDTTIYCTGILYIVITRMCGPGSSVGIAYWLRAGRSGIVSWWGRDFPPVQTGPGAHPAYCTMGTGSFPGVKCGRGVLLTTHPLLVPRSWKSRAIPLPTLWPTPGLERDHFMSRI